MTRIRTFLAGLALAIFGAIAPLHYAPTTVLGYPVAQAQALTDAGENAIIDALFRAQSLGAPATWYVALDTTACSDSAAGTEVTGGSYARASLAASLANWKATDGGTSSASTGTGGQTKNAVAITFPAPTANWGSVTHFRLVSASSGGTTWICQALTTPKTINSGDAAPSFAIDAITVTFQ